MKSSAKFGATVLDKNMALIEKESSFKNINMNLTSIHLILGPLKHRFWKISRIILGLIVADAGTILFDIFPQFHTHTAM